MKSKMTSEAPSLRDLIDAGAHFGHRKEWSTPASRAFTFTVRDGVCVINLEETQSRLVAAATYLEEQASRGATILLVGTKRQAQEAVARLGKELGIFFVGQRWLGGTLTNFSVIRNNVQRLARIEQTLGDEKAAAALTKREKLRLAEHAKKLHRTLDGITDMTKLPDVIVVIDPAEETTAVREARAMGLSIVAILDTDADPTEIDYPIPANDDAPKTIELLLTYLGEAIKRGNEKSTKSETRNPKQ